MSIWSERQRLEAEYQDLNYLWEEEVFSAHCRLLIANGPNSSSRVLSSASARLNLANRFRTGGDSP